MNSEQALPDRTEVRRVARSFATAVADTPVVVEYGGAIEAVRADETAMKLLRQIDQARRALNVAGAWNNDGSPERQRVTELEQAMQHHATLQRFFTAQNELVERMRALNIELNEPLGFDFAAMARPACACGA